LAVKIRLKRFGKKKQAHYRVVIAESSQPRDGKNIEIVGSYNPTVEPSYFDVNDERVKYWLSVGAQPTETVARLLGEKGIMEKIKKVPKEPGVSKKERKQKSETAQEK
jgi:small subunit ribosomal protein S16